MGFCELIYTTDVGILICECVINSSFRKCSGIWMCELNILDSYDLASEQLWIEYSN